MRAHPLTVERGERGDRAVGPPHVAGIVDAEQQPEIAAASQLVDLTQARGQAGHLRGLRTFEGLQMRVGRRQFRGGGRQPRLGLLLLFEPDVPLDLEPAQLHQQRLFRREQLLGLGLKGAQPLGGAALGFLGGRPAAGNREGRHNHDDTMPQISHDA